MVEILTVTEGKVTHVRVPGGKTIAVKPPVSLNKYPFEVLNNYLTVYSDLHKDLPLEVEVAGHTAVPLAQLVPPATVPHPTEVVDEKELETWLPETVEVEAPPVDLEEEAETGEKYVVDVRLPEPSDCIKAVPKVYVDQFLAELLMAEKNRVSIVGISERIFGKPANNNLVYKAMVLALRAKGVVHAVNPTGKRVTAYELSWDWELFKQFVKSKPFGITHENLAKKFWITPEMAREKLEDAVDRGFLEKHPRKDEYQADSELLKKFYANGKPPEQDLSKYGSTPKAVATQLNIPSPEEFEFVKTHIICTVCRRSYNHGYIRGSWKLCGGDYEKIGGSKSHGAGATIKNARK